MCLEALLELGTLTAPFIPRRRAQRAKEYELAALASQVAGEDERIAKAKQLREELERERKRIYIQSLKQRHSIDQAVWTMKVTNKFDSVSNYL